MSAPAVGTTLAERYELVALLGAGGMASVYRAHDRRLDRPVAIKVLQGRRVDEAGVAFREDRITAGLSHPHIVGVYDSGVTPDGRPFLVMELIEGEPVSRLAPLPPDRALAVAAEVTAAVQHAHERGIVHCDIKPQNVLLDAYDRARLTDFGVASADRTPVGAQVYGSAAYIAPERLRGAPTSPAVDIFALGGLLYYLIAGHPPYAGAAPEEIVAQVEAGAPPPLAALSPAVPPAVDTIVRRAMAADPADRYPSAAALYEALREAREVAARRTGAPDAAADPLADTTALPSAPAAAASVVLTRRGRPRWLLPALAALLLALLVFGLARAVAGTRDANTGATTVAVPALEGVGLGEARRRLRDAGLVPGRVDTAPLPGPPGVVVYQNPPAGARVRQGARVDFVIRAVAPAR